MSDNLPADWALERAMSESNVEYQMDSVKTAAAVALEKSSTKAPIKILLALARRIEATEQPPVDPVVRLVADVINAFQSRMWMIKDYVMDDSHKEALERAVAVYREKTSDQ